MTALVLALLMSTHAGPEAPERPDSTFDAIAREGIGYVYNLQFEEADTAFTRLISMRPGHPAGHFFLAMVNWWRIMIDMDNTAYDERFVDSLEGVIDLCDDILDKHENDVTALFFKGGALGFIGRLKFHRDDWLGAADAGRKALPIVQDASAADPENCDIYLGTGIYNYYAEVIPEQYPVAKPLLLFIPAGDRKKGIRQLHIAAAKGKYASVEAAYFLMQLYYQYEKLYADALAIARDLHRRFPGNMLFHKYVGRCYVSMNNLQMADSVFRDILARCAAGRRGYNAVTEREAEYYVGVYEMSMDHDAAALQHFFRCDELSRRVDQDGPSGFMVLANLKAGMACDALGRREDALRQYSKVLRMKEYQNSHELAERYLETPWKR